MRDESKYRKKRGPKPWNNLYQSKVDVRLSDKDNNALNRLADRYGESRSNIMRKALKDFIRFNEEDDRKER